MKPLHLAAAALLAAGLLCPPLVAAHPEHVPPPAQATPAPRDASATDLVLLLDTSNSMDGLIDQAKRQLWSVVRQYAGAARDGELASLRVSLFEYGNSGLPATENYIRQVVPLTSDLDAISAALFGLRTNGGDEYCGAVIDAALTRLDWAPHPAAYRAIFIAGNEPFTQGPTWYLDACQTARQRGMIVNTIHCGDASQGREGQWSAGAAAGGGVAFNIDQDRQVPVVPAPQDPRLIELGAAMNGTYLWYGDAADRGYYQQNQMAQDDNAQEMGEAAAADRASIKSSGNAYNNRGRDLVDSYAADNAILDRVDADKLPEAMQAMTPDERVEHVKQLTGERERLKAEIAKLSAERAEFLAKDQAKLADGGDTLGDALAAAVRQQLQAAGFTVANPTTRPGE